MKALLKKIIFFIIQLEAKLILKKYKPKIIAVTGSVGKTSTKDAIHSALSSSLYIGKNQKSYNSEIGIPLAVLGRESGWNSLWKWLKNIMEGLALILLPNFYPKWLVIEAGIDHPGDMDFTNRLIKSDVAVFTRFAKTPVHVGFFKSREELIKEKKKLIKSLKDGGFLVLNADDEDVLKIREDSGKHAITFGFSESADIRASNLEVLYRDGRPVGINFKVGINGSSVPVELLGVLGVQHVYPVLVSLAVGKALGLNALDLVKALKNHVPAPSRMRVLDGIYNTTIIDDSYNSSPVAAEEALNVLNSLKVSGGRKIAVLGDMAELGEHIEEEHLKLGEKVAGVVDVLIVIGQESKSISKSAIQSGLSKENVHEFKNSSDAADFVEDFLKENDVVLIKGSQSIRLEKVVKRILAKPEDARWLLVRQEEEWLNK